MFNAKQAKESAIDILDGLDEYCFDDNLYIESIREEPTEDIHHLTTHRRDVEIFQNILRAIRQGGRDEMV